MRVLKRFPTKTKYFLNCTKHVRWISAFWVFAVAYNFIIHPIIKSSIQITTRASVDNRNAIPLYRAIPSIYNHKMSHRSVICNQQHAYQLANQSAKIEDLVTHFINWAHRMLCDDKIQRKITKMQIKYTTSKSKSFSWIYKKQYKIQKWNPAGDQCMRYTQCQDVTITVRVLHVLFYACNWPIIMKQIWQIVIAWDVRPTHSRSPLQTTTKTTGLSMKTKHINCHLFVCETVASHLHDAYGMALNDCSGQQPLCVIWK